MVRRRPPSDQLRWLRGTVIELHTGEGGTQYRVRHGGTRVFQRVDGHSGRAATRGLLDHLLHAAPDRLVVVGIGPDHEAVRFRVDCDAGLRHDLQQELRQCGSVGCPSTVHDHL